MESLMQFMVIAALAPVVIMLLVKVLFWTGVLGTVGYISYTDKKAEKQETKLKTEAEDRLRILAKQHGRPEDYYVELSRTLEKDT